MEPILAFIAVLVLLFFLNSIWSKSSQRKKEHKNYKQYLKQFDDAKSKVKLPPVFTSVAGVNYPNDDTGISRQKLIAKAKVGEYLMLVPDEQNKFDKDAVRVYRLNGDQIGFLDMDLAGEIKSRIKERTKVEAKIVSFTEKEKGAKGVNIEIQKYSRRQ